MDLKRLVFPTIFSWMKDQVIETYFEIRKDLHESEGTGFQTILHYLWFMWWKTIENQNVK